MTGRTQAGVPLRRGASAPVGHPAHGRYEFIRAGLLACGSSLLSGLPDAHSRQWHGGQRLAAYSCGGSAGMDGFPSHRLPSSLPHLRRFGRTLMAARWLGSGAAVNAAKGVVDRNESGTEPNRRRRVQAPFTADRVGQSRYIMAYLLSEWTCPCLPVLLQQPAIAAKECRFHASLSQAGYGYIVRCSSPTNRWARARASWSFRRAVAEETNDAVP